MNQHAPLLRQDGQRDGRALRAVRTRQRILDAVRCYADEGQYRPICKQIAHRARVSPRSIFQHWPDLDAVRFEALTEDHVRVICAKLAMLEPRERVAAFVHGRLG